MSERVVGQLTATGAVIDPSGGMRDLPPKQWREHRWVVVAAYVVSTEQAEAMHDAGGGTVLLDASNLHYIGVGCYDCEQPYALARGNRCTVGRA